jgi:hypothetical protein
MTPRELWEDGEDKRVVAKACEFQPGDCPICDDELCVLCTNAYDCEHDTDQRHGWGAPCKTG